jgi:tetratricopeptide (TPR) repeat protein
VELLSNRPADARQVANEVQTLAPGNPAARVVIVQTMQATGDLAGAKRLVADLVRQYPDWTPVQYEAARVAVAQGDWAAASSAIARLDAINPDSKEAFEGRLAVAVGKKDYKSAFALLDARLAKTPKDERLLLVAAQVYWAAGEGARAESALRTLLTVNPGSNAAYDQLGRIYAQLGRLPEAETQFAALAERSGETGYGWTLAAVLAHAQGKLDVARQRYEKALSVNPESPVAANNLAYMYVEKGENLDVALNLAQTAKRLNPENADYIDTLGVVLMKKRLFSAAIAELETAANLSPKSAIIHLHLAQALAGGGNADEARRVARRALAIDPSFPEAKDARAIAEGKSD